MSHLHYTLGLLLKGFETCAIISFGLSFCSFCLGVMGSGSSLSRGMRWPDPSCIMDGIGVFVLYDGGTVLDEVKGSEDTGYDRFVALQ